MQFFLLLCDDSISISESAFRLKVIQGNLSSIGSWVWKIQVLCGWPDTIKIISFLFLDAVAFLAPTPVNRLASSSGGVTFFWNPLHYQAAASSMLLRAAWQALLLLLLISLLPLLLLLFLLFQFFTAASATANTMSTTAFLLLLPAATFNVKNILHRIVGLFIITNIWGMWQCVCLWHHVAMTWKMLIPSPNSWIDCFQKTVVMTHQFYTEEALLPLAEWAVS